MSYKIYGIKTCNSVRSALKFFKDNNIEVEFCDLRKEPPSSEEVKFWVDKAGIDTVFNNKGAKYRDLKLKELNLDDNGKFEWLCKEPMLVKRPVVVFDNNVLVGFKEDIYKETFK
ncbi:arsenate reductase family protein [Halarcobacter sp.]|uniref:arsenate reductase family protein n=1 Tax=Halarcobacter sp. TaxID=2321133 RepID=UPI002AA81E38|nr:arsenate reductase family protein [Halarcobacter sp.]|eukprot:Anaeramoba_ignava/a372439_3.p1 GENE.a372439_3~~a372439_3.p1  ORF type:complete len:115 (-),score=11.09 a372439_3:168-512(-)